MKAWWNLSAVRVLAWLLCLVLLIGGVFLAWDFIDDLVKDALEARFESAPAEGFGYWYRRELFKDWWMIALLLSPFVIGIGFLLRSALRWLQHSK
jgi:hypothetical protein